MSFPGLHPVYHGAVLPPLPTTGMTANFDFSDISTLYKTFSTPSINPCYSNVATADGDVIQVARSIFPVATSDYTFPYSAADSTRSPVLKSTTPLLGSACLAFDGSNDSLYLATRDGSFVGNGTIFSVSAKTILASFRCAVLPSSGNKQALFADSEFGHWGVYISNTAGTVSIIGQNDDGGVDTVTGDVVAADTNYVVAYRHDAGNIYISLNGGTESGPVASGNTSGFSGQGSRLSGGGDNFFNGRIGQLITYNVGLSGTDLSNAITYLLSKWG